MAAKHRSIPTLTWQDIARFWSQVAVAPGKDCWNWRGATFPEGYGAFWLQGQTYRASRIAWYIVHGPIPDGLVIMHVCDNPGCCNIGHLCAAAQATNDADRVRKGRSACGVVSGRAKVDAVQVCAIRRRYAAGGVTQAQLAEEFGVIQTTISNIVRRKTWSHLT